jgi:NAD(P) transhydrogenase subunit alpha
MVQSGAGLEAGFPDRLYEEAGATVVTDRGVLFDESVVITQVRAGGYSPATGEADLMSMKAHQILVGFLDPLSAPEGIVTMASRQITAFAMELIPRTSRAQSMDALSSQANIAGYKAALMAANLLPRVFPMLMTAAGTITPARVFVVGVGVAGLQAIATCKRLGAVIQAYDVRSAVKEQVLSVGAQFVEFELETTGAEGSGGYARAMDETFYRKQREMMLRVVADNDVVITTAAIPGKKAPILITEEMVTGMRAGSVIIDMAAERGGNCEITEPGETVIKHNVTIVGPVNLPATAPYHASQMYSNNVVNFLRLMIKEGALNPGVEDDIVQESMVTRDGDIVNARVKELTGINR